MNHEVFKLNLSKAKKKLATSTKLNSSYLRIEKDYLTYIQFLIESLNQCEPDDESKRTDIIAHLHDANRIFLNANNIKLQSHILFTRHGESTPWAQKGLGFIPNAPISPSAQEGMANTHQSSINLLSIKDRLPRIIISPLTRALQTAGYILPKEVTNADITIDPALAENSVTPSGFDIRSKQDLESFRNNISFWREPYKAILFFFTSLLYGERDFVSKNRLRKDAILRIEKHTGDRSIVETTGDVVQDLAIDRESKIIRIKQHIHDTSEGTLWLIGHGNNFRTFIKKFLGVDVSFDYAETHSVYKTLDEQQAALYFIPPYSLVINQSTGKIEGKFNRKAVFTKELETEVVHTPVTVEPSYAVMQRKGLHPQFDSAMDLYAQPRILPEEAGKLINVVVSPPTELEQSSFSI